MGKALYRKYRSKSLSEVVGQDHVTTVLANALKSGSLSHAYLLTGPRGVGKTSVARILAHAANGLDYSGDEINQLDIIEIDAASNRRIDEIRELRERVNIAPTSARFKVYIIDEVHMLTKEAFNALLKTLEEPPEHVIFILATTEAHKLPETIISRTQRLNFKPVTVEETVKHLKKIAKQEKITISDDALELLARHGEGSMRDSISLLDQLRHSAREITLDNVQSAIGQAPQSLIDELLMALRALDQAKLTDVIDSIKQAGTQAPEVAHQLLNEFRGQLASGQLTLPKDQVFDLMQALLSVDTSIDPQLKLELSLYQTVLDQVGDAKVSDSGSSTVNSQPKKIQAPLKHPVKPSQMSNTENNGALSADNWEEVLGALKKRHNTLYGLVRMAEPAFGNDTLTLKFGFQFHKKRLDEGKNQQLLVDTIKEVTGQPIIIVTEVGVLATPSIVYEQEQPTGTFETISNIFGGAEIVD